MTLQGPVEDVQLKTYFAHHIYRMAQHHQHILVVEFSELAT
jgi:hypothetical protein